MKPRALDLFCGAGGATKGLQQAGFHVTGVDIDPQPRYCGDVFHQADALTFPLDGFDFIWASPPCEGWSQCTAKKYRSNHPQLIAPMRRRLINEIEEIVPWTIENVPSARHELIRPFMLCGSMFGLRVRRHRYFEKNGFSLALLPSCDHSVPPVLITGTHRRTYEPRYEYSAQQCRDAAQLSWMCRTDMDKAIPPAYSEWIGRQALAYLEIAA
jgi:DNA (cytosine-5)-methyltransferase 1